MSGPARRVSFLVIGAQKAGTSALFEYLREVPGLQLPAVKEAHFFDDESVDWAVPDYEPYHALFEPDDRLCGEATPIYCYWPNAAERIQRYNPAMRLIMLLRNPIERAWSHWKMEYARGNEAQPFAWCIREGRARMNQAQPYPGFDRVMSYVERGFYGAQISHLLTLFPAGQILLLQSRNLSADPGAAVARICEFLGVAPPVQPIVPRRTRVAKDMAYPSVLRDADVTYLQQLYDDDQHASPRCSVHGHETNVIRRNHTGLSAWLRARLLHGPESLSKQLSGLVPKQLCDICRTGILGSTGAFSSPLWGKGGIKGLLAQAEGSLEALNG